MVAVYMAQQNQVDLAQPRVVGAGDIVGHVVENANAGRIFEYRRAIVRSKLSWVRAYRRDFYILSDSRRCCQGKGERCACIRGLHICLPWFG
jgi:hypothetical protein